MNAGLSVRDCPHHKCDRQIFDAVYTMRNKRIDVVLDADPAPFPDGNYKVLAHQPTPGQVLVDRVTSAHQAFGLKTLYQLHSKTCLGNRTVVKEKGARS